MGGNVTTVRTLGASIAIAVVLSCDSNTPTEPDFCGEIGTVTATVTVTTMVALDWSPRCAVAAVIFVGPGGQTTWIVTAPGFSSSNATPSANIILPPVVYGQIPSGAEERDPPISLTPGSDYMVTLSKGVSASSTAQCAQRTGNFCLVAVKAFQR
jgi:hypothetical protein